MKHFEVKIAVRSFLYFFFLLLRKSGAKNRRAMLYPRWRGKYVLSYFTTLLFKSTGMSYFLSNPRYLSIGRISGSRLLNLRYISL